LRKLEIGSFEAKNKLSDLLAKAEKGQTIYITRRGKRVAILMPPDSVDPAKGSGNGPSLMEESGHSGPLPSPDPNR